jgi:cobalt-precorrin 5A hydrolase/precorrin-3B C17-methyltransferase
MTDLSPAATALAPRDGPQHLALGFSAAAIPLLVRLQQSGLVQAIRWPDPPVASRPTAGDQLPPGDPAPQPAAASPSPSDWLRQHWSSSSAVLAVGACGLVTRLIAPLLRDKRQDPAVLVIDPAGRFVISLLGGHAAGGDRLCQQVAALLGAEAIISAGGSGADLLALDAFGRHWGWRRGAGDWNRLLRKAAAGHWPAVEQQTGQAAWRQLQAAAMLPTMATTRPELVIGPRLGEGCRWHPPCLWLGIGCERGTSLSLLERLVDETLARHDLAAAAVAGLASIDRKGDEPALLELAARRGWPLKLFVAAELAPIAVPHPSAAVQREMGTASVAEAAALRATAAATAQLLVAKTIARARPQERGAATLAVALAPQQWAPQRGALHLVGSGPGQLDLLSGDARAALASATVWLGYSPYLDLLEPLRRPDQLRCEGRLTEERARCAEALDLAIQGLPVALVSSGDSGIYGMAGLALELWLQRHPSDRPAFQVHPGISALQLAAARAGAPLMHDFCTISLSDRLTPWEVIERRLRAAAAGDFVVALYNPRSQGREWQLARAVALLLEERPPSTPVALARQLGRPQERLSLHELGSLPVQAVDMLTLVLIGNSTSYVASGRMVTPRGYPGAVLS